MSKEYKLLHDVCIRCKHYADGESCKSKDECPVYQLYQIAKGIKPKVVWSRGFPITEEEKERVAKGYAWANNYVFVQKDTFARSLNPIENVVAISIADIVETAVLFGLNYKEIKEE